MLLYCKLILVKYSIMTIVPQFTGEFAGATVNNTLQ